MSDNVTEARPPDALTSASAAPTAPLDKPDTVPQTPTLSTAAANTATDTAVTPPATPAEATTPNPTSTTQPAAQPAAPAVDIATVIEKEIAKEAEPIDTSNFYIFGDPKHDRDRLIAQARLFGDYVQQNAQRLLRIKPERILDIGCGEGQITTVFNKVYRNAKVLGVDIDPKAIEAAKLRLKRIPGVNPQNVQFEAMDITQTLPDGPFDLIYASLVFLHLADPEKTLKMCLEKLKPGGLLWIKEGGNFPNSEHHPVFNSWVEKTMNAMAKMGRKLMIVKELPEMLERNGFTEIREFTETYEMRDNTVNGRVMMSIALASTYNTIPMLSKLEGIPVDELKKMHETVRSEFEKFPITSKLPNLIAQKPLPEQTPASTEPEKTE